MMAERWDRVVRLTHWCVALGFLSNRLYLTEPGSVWHQSIGLMIVALIAVRLIWGRPGLEARLACLPLFPLKLLW